MVAGLPKPRATTDEDAGRLQASRGRCTALAGELETLIDRDSAAYEMVVSAYRLPKDTDEGTRARAARIQEAMREAVGAPLDVMRACAGAIEQAAVVASLGNANALSDVLVGLELLTAGLRCARANVEINLGTVRDPVYVQSVREETDRLGRESERLETVARERLKLPV
jgi:formiminotetrahydrofolate cyclodeaminase